MLQHRPTARHTHTLTHSHTYIHLQRILPLFDKRSTPSINIRWNVDCGNCRNDEQKYTYVFIEIT